MGGGSCQTHPRACLAAQVEGLVWSPAPPSSAFPSHRAEVTLPAGHQETSLEPIATHLRYGFPWGGLPASGSLQEDLQGSDEKPVPSWEENVVLATESGGCALFD